MHLDFGFLHWQTRSRCFKQRNRGKALKEKRHLLPVYDIYRIAKIKDSSVLFIPFYFRGGDRHAFYY